MVEITEVIKMSVLLVEERTKNRNVLLELLLFCTWTASNKNVNWEQIEH